MVVNRKGSTKRTNIRYNLETNSNNNHGNYWNPLTIQVEALENITHQIERIEKEKVKILMLENTITQE